MKGDAMYVFITLWILSSGQIVGDPWKTFDNLEDCAKVREVTQKAFSTDRFLFTTGCLSQEDLHRYTALDFTLKKGTDQ